MEVLRSGNPVNHLPAGSIRGGEATIASSSLPYFQQDKKNILDSGRTPKNKLGIFLFNWEGFLRVETDDRTYRQTGRQAGTGSR